MKYFTPQLWIGFNSPRRQAAFKTWDKRFKAYKRTLRTILPRLNPQGRRFFQNVLVLHDGTLTRLEVGNRIWDPGREGRRGDINRCKVAVRMFVLSDSFDRVCELEYKEVTRVDLNFPGKLELFPFGKFPNFGDWGYDELTLVGKRLFRHDILFASGATIAIEFQDFGFSRRRAEKLKQKRS
jgi:hypothetical protein